MKRWTARRGVVLATSVALVAVSVARVSAQQTPPSAQDQPPAPAAPADLSQLGLEELAELKIDSVYGASRYVQKVTEAPSSVTIITADEIHRYGHRTLADILRSVRGFYVTYDHNYSYLGVRGFSRPGDYNARVLLLVDGHRLNDSIFGGALIGSEFPMDVDLIERVEIIRGPSSSLYGTNAFFGVINVITRRPDAMPGARVSGTLATFDTRDVRVSYGRTLGKSTGLLLSASSYRSEGQRRIYFGEFNDPASNNGIAEHADEDSFGHVFGKLTRGNVTVQGLYGSRDKTIPTASFDTVFNDPRNRTIERLGYLDLQYEGVLGRDWQVGSRVYYDRYAYDGDYVFDYSESSTPELVVNRDFARGDWWGAELKATRKLARRHTVTAGVEYRDNFRQDQYNYDEQPFAQYLDDRRDSRNWALYLQDEITLHDRLILNAGLRHDHYDTFGGTTNPRIGLIYKPVEKTTLKLLYGAAFRAPNAYELYWLQSGVSKANPKLMPETNDTTEVVLERYLGSRVRIGAIGFYYRVSDLITQQTDPEDDLLVYNNVDSMRGQGIELEAESKWPNGYQGRVSYTFQNSRNTQTGARLTNSPRHLAQLNLMAPLAARHLLGGLELQYLSRRLTLTGDEVGAVVVPNVTFVSRTLPKGFELSTGVYNLFDRRYADPGSEEHRQDAIVQHGRSFRVKLTYSFAHPD